MARKKSKAKKSTAKKAKTKKVKKTARKAAAKRGKAPARKAAAKRRKAPARKAAARKSAKKSSKTAVKKTTRKAPARKAKNVAGEGSYTASRNFRKKEEAFIKKNRASIPQMGKEAEAALEGPEGTELQAAEAEASEHGVGME